MLLMDLSLEGLCPVSLFYILRPHHLKETLFGLHSNMMLIDFSLEGLNQPSVYLKELGVPNHHMSISIRSSKVLYNVS